MEHCAHMQVLIVCPTGYLVNQYKSKLPDVPGAENVRIDTIQGVLNYKRAGADSRVTWTPPSALRRIDLILMDEGSQYEDREWVRLFVVIDNGIPGPRFYYFRVVRLHLDSNLHVRRPSVCFEGVTCEP